MERSGHDAPGVLHPTDLTDLVRSPGPFLTVWGTSAAQRQPDVRTSLVSALREVPDSGLPDTVLDGVVAALDEVMRGADGAVVVADSGGVRLAEALPQPPRSTIARVGALPSLSPVIEQRQGAIPFVLVVTDRQGADIYWSAPDDTGVTTVAGDTERPYSKPRHGGGWAHKRMQQKVENTWDSTAAEVADTLVQVADQVKPRVITVAGDIRMVQLLRDRLPAALGAMLREVPGSRSEDGSDEHRDDAIRRWVRTAVAEDTVAVLQLFEQEHGQQDRAANGVAPTLDALREARVDVLLVHDDADDTRSAWFVPDDPSLVALDPGPLRDLGHEPVQGRAVDVAIRAALGTGAGLRVVPNADPVDDGLGAILRW